MHMPDTPTSSRGGFTSTRTTTLVLRGSLAATLLLAALLLTYNSLYHSIWLDDTFWVIFSAVAYLLFAEILLRKGRQRTANWLIISFYLLLAFTTLLIWGLNAPIGILTISFPVILSSALMGARSIPIVVGASSAMLFFVQLMTSCGFIHPDTKSLSLPSTMWDVLSYATILSIFGLVAWAASSQREKNLKRALQAEQALTQQKDSLRQELEKESAVLRLTQLKQIRQLHTFALLGQSTAATLHELSNHLSILNLDINDLDQQHSQSKAIANAKGSLATINKMVRQTRQQLNSYNQVETFNALTVVNQSIKDMQDKFLMRHVTLTRGSSPKSRAFSISGSPLALMQIITILLNNAIDACYDSPYPKVEITIHTTKDTLSVIIADNGPGIDPAIQTELFNPVASTKATGMGVGLYIARHLAKSQFHGDIKLVPTDIGATFNVKIARDTSNV